MNKIKDDIMRFLMQHFYNTYVGWTPAFQSYYSAGDEAEPYCLECETYLTDESEQNFCPKCGRYLIWHEPLFKKKWFIKSDKEWGIDDEM